MTYRIIFSYINHLCDGTYQIADSVCIQVKTDAASSDPVRVLYDGLCGKEHLLAVKNSIIYYDNDWNIRAVYTDIHFA